MQKICKLDSPDRTDDLTIDEVKSLPTFREWDDQRIANLIKAIKTLSGIMYHSWAGRKKLARNLQ